MSKKKSASSDATGPPMEAAANFGNSIRESVAARFRRHDSTFSVSSDYDYGSSNDLNMRQGAALLTADCLGTGILALPHDIRVLGVGLGVGFLILNLPINLYAGTILSDAAGFVEGRQGLETENFDLFPQTIEEESGKEAEGLLQDRKYNGDKDYKTLANDDVFEDAVQDHSLHHDTATFDFIGMTSALFRKRATTLVMVLFYTNIFLVLGDYILVMSHAVAALFGESWLCIPQAGLLASTLMFAVSQLRNMANLGRSASIISLSALFIVVVQCLYFANHADPNNVNDDQVTEGSESGEFSLLRKLSAIGSIGFAVGSQKLFLNIRHELADRKSAPKSLAVSLSAFGTFYVAIVLSAGSNPPGFLFDVVPSGIHRRLGGLFLWIHVVVSYAINSQAICASMDRLFFYNWGPVKSLEDHQRWMILTGMISVSAFFVANAIPFFKDLVALIGALTSVPLTLLLPALYHRRVLGVPIWWPTKTSLVSYALVLFSLLFIATALIGAVHSIISDWEHHTGGFFSCH